MSGLKDKFKDYFYVGCAVSTNPQIDWNVYGNVIEQEFSCFTMENVTKPKYVFDFDACKKGVKEDQAFVGITDQAFKTVVSLLNQKGLKMKLHTLLWHEETPEWFFCNDYEIEKGHVTADVMKQRLKNYIHLVLGYFDLHYPGLIYSIDVVNEAFNGKGNYEVTDYFNLKGIKHTNYWYEILKEDYVYYAYLYAKEAINQSKSLKNVELVYNDYDMPSKAKRVFYGLEAIFKNHGENVHDYIDTIGFQAHYDYNIEIESVQNAALLFLNQGYQLQVTELDIGIPNIPITEYPSEQDFLKQKKVYHDLMTCLLNLIQQGYRITSVTLWGFSDGYSWRRNREGHNEHALIFDEAFQKKPAYYGMYLDESAKE